MKEERKREGDRGGGSHMENKLMHNNKNKVMTW